MYFTNKIAKENAEHYLRSTLRNALVKANRQNYTYDEFSEALELISNANMHAIYTLGVRKAVKIINQEMDRCPYGKRVKLFKS